MAALQDIKNHIDSVKKTKKITQAMKMVAASKFKRAVDATLRSDPYLNNIEEILQDFIHYVEISEKPILMEKNESKKEVVIIISGDRGLCGGFNANIFKFAEQYLNAQTVKPDLILLGSKVYQHFKNKNVNIQYHHELSSDIVSVEGVRSLINPYIIDFKEQKIGKLVVLSNEFVSALTSNLVNKVLLPVVIEKNDQGKEIDKIKSDFFYEPSKESVIDYILEEYIYFLIYKLLLKSKAAEESARMTAMDSASENATEMIKSLTLAYNRSRQAKITSEISEIVAGAEALVH